MADYYSILNKTVSGLPNNNAETRNLVYAKARTTIDRQLRSLSPAPSETAVAAQMEALESAIRRIEAEYSAVPADMTEAPTLAAPPPPPAAVPQPAPPPAPPAQSAPAPRPAPPPADDLGSAVAMAREERSAPQQVEERSSGGFVTFLVWLIVLAAVGAGAYAMWTNREPLLAAIGMEDLFEGPTTTVQDTTQEEPASAADDESSDLEKEEARLNGEGETVVPTPEPETAEQQDSGESSVVQREVRTVEPESEDVEVSPVDEGESLAESADETESGAPEIAEEESFEVPAIGQKAYLYEEGLGNAAATRDNAAIIWSTDQQAPADGLPRETVIKGLLEVPGRGLTMDLTIKRNVDEALSASHIIELAFDAPPDFSGGNIDTLARFVMKSSEQARGEPLVAVPVKINAGFFMIALNNLEQARESNRRLLLESSWIDIPLGYTSGRRALVTLEKGAIGDQVFREAFEDWDSRQ